MMPYTKEQIAETVVRVKEASIYDHPNQLAIKDCKVLLSALESAERENSDWQEYNAALLHRAEVAEARCAELEASGNALRFYIWLNKKTKDVAGNGQIRLAPPCVQAWDAIVGKKEG